MSTRNAFICTIQLCLCLTAFSDQPVTNRPVVRSSENGSVYAKSVPSKSFGQEGKTQVFSVAEGADTLICEYGWFATEIYIGGAGDRTLIRFGSWHQGSMQQDKNLALGIYRAGKTVREYTTPELILLGSGVSHSATGHRVFERRLGFRWLNGNAYVYEVEGVSGKTFTFDLNTGAIVEKAAGQPAGSDAEDHAPQP